MHFIGEWWPGVRQSAGICLAGVTMGLAVEFALTAGAWQTPVRHVDNHGGAALYSHAFERHQQIALEHIESTGSAIFYPGPYRLGYRHIEL